MPFGTSLYRPPFFCPFGWMLPGSCDNWSARAAKSSPAFALASIASAAVFLAAVSNSGCDSTASAISASLAAIPGAIWSEIRALETVPAEALPAIRYAL